MSRARVNYVEGASSPARFTHFQTKQGHDRTQDSDAGRNLFRQRARRHSENVTFAVGFLMTVRARDVQSRNPTSAAECRRSTPIYSSPEDLAFVVQRPLLSVSKLKRKLSGTDLANDPAERLFGLPIGIRRSRRNEMNRTQNAIRNSRRRLLGHDFHRRRR